MNDYNVVEIIDGLKVIDEVTIGIMTKAEKELGKPFGMINWMYISNQVVIIRLMANEVKEQNFSDEQIIEFLDKERSENGDLSGLQDFFENIFDVKKKTAKKRKAKRK